MKARLDDLPQVRPRIGDAIRGHDWGGMSSTVISFPTGTDLCPMLEGLENDHCQCPHWGYLLRGRIRVRYEDGSEEVVEPGEIYYWPPGHTILIEEESLNVEFSPADQMNRVLDHVVGKMG